MRDYDAEKVKIQAMFYTDNWERMEKYDSDRENIEWHVHNCMTYITQRSEDVEPVWMMPEELVLEDDWTEKEILALYRDLSTEALPRGYKPDPGVMTRIQQLLAPPVRIKMRRYVRP
jgi:hypothetical protein